MFRKISNTWSLMKSSLSILKADKELLVFSLLSLIACVAVIASFYFPLTANGTLAPPGEGANTSEVIQYYSILFLFYICNYFVVIYFNTAIIACAVKRIQGENPTLADGFQAATSRLLLIFGWTLVMATVGLILRILEDRSEGVAKFLTGLLGMAWSLMTFLAVPVFTVERVGPIESLKTSTRLLKKSWGEQIIGDFSFGMIFFLFSIPGIIAIPFGLFVYNVPLPRLLIVGGGILYLLILGLIQGTLNSIFRAVVYVYAREGITPEGFQQGQLSSIFRRR